MLPLHASIRWLQRMDALVSQTVALPGTNANARFDICWW